MKIDIEIVKDNNRTDWCSNKRSYSYFNVTYKNITKSIVVNIPFTGIINTKEEIALSSFVDDIELSNIIKLDYHISENMSEPRFFDINGNYHLMYRGEINSISDFMSKEKNIDFNYYLIRLSCTESIYFKEKDLFNLDNIKFSSMDYPYYDGSRKKNDEQVNVLFKNKLCKWNY